MVRYLGVIFTPSESAANQWHRLKHHGEALPKPKAELKRGGNPPPPSSLNGAIPGWP